MIELRKLSAFFVAALGISLPPPALADSVIIPDAANVKYAVGDGKAYFRNLDEFNPAFSGCCFDYWLDLSTDTGRAMFATFLSKQISGQPVVLFKLAPSDGAIEYVGNF